MKNNKEQIDELYQVAQEYADNNNCLYVISIACKNKECVLASILFAEDIDIKTGKHINGISSCMGELHSVLHTAKILANPK